MTDRITLTLANEAELQRRIGEVVRKLERPRELMDRIGALMEQNVQFRFDTKTAPDGTRWLPLAASTRAAYEVKYEGNVPGSLLERTRHMRDSLTYVVGISAPYFVEVGFGDEIALYHETGTRRGLPRRQLLTDDPIAGTLGAGDRQDILDEISAYLSQL